jgi:CAAX prenyl protease-like protein
MSDSANENQRTTAGAGDREAGLVAAVVSSDVLPYVIPMFAYVALGSVDSLLPKVDGHSSPVWYPISYTVKLLIVAGLMIYYRATWNDFLPIPSWRALATGALAGAFVVVMWVGLDGWYGPLPMTGHREEFDPSSMPVGGWRWGFIVVRMIGLVVVVPIVEELFWRSFAMRWVIDQDFQKVPVGKVTWTAGAITSALFAVAHPEWLPALLTGALWAALLWQTRSLMTCLVSHAVANLGLGVYVLISGDWKYW